MRAYRCEIDLSPGSVMVPETEEAGVMTFLMRIFYSKAPSELRVGEVYP